jgi:predicted DNA binding CopG/RHH family protein
MERDFILDQKELDLLDELDNYKPVENLKDEVTRLANIAQENISKRKAISIKMLEADLEKIKSKAIEQGMPYQTLINSILHQFANGKLVSKIS